MHSQIIYLCMVLLILTMFFLKMMMMMEEEEEENQQPKENEEGGEGTKKHDGYSASCGHKHYNLFYIKHVC